MSGTEQSERLTRLEAEIQHLRDFFESENGIHKQHINRMERDISEVKSNIQKLFHGDEDKPGFFEEFRNMKKAIHTQGKKQTVILSIIISALYTGKELGIIKAVLGVFG